jgi:hypothetical protein
MQANKEGKRKEIMYSTVNSPSPNSRLKILSGHALSGCQDFSNEQMELPHPLCCQVSFFKNNCNDSTFCKRFGQIGFKYFDDKRSTVMLVAAGFSLFASILSIVAVIATSLDDDTVMNTNWTYGESDNIKYFVGLEKIVYRANGDTVGVKWGSTDCVDDYCKDCKSACAASVSFAIINLITSFPTLMTDLQRSTAKGDLNCQKFMGMLTAFIGFVTNLSSLSTYANSCYRNLPSDDPFGDPITFYLGPGFVCILIATMLKPIDFFVHLLTPVSAREDEEKM